jgi:CRISPR-associated endoribonuclease Cas6
MAKTVAKPKVSSRSKLAWNSKTELVGLTLELRPQEDITVAPHYTTELHSWFLNQVRRTDIELSTYLHDGQSEKPFTISNLSGELQTQGRSLLLPAHQSYEWTITALSQPLVAWMQKWLKSPPTEVKLRSGTFDILTWQLAQPPSTYTQLLEADVSESTITLSFLTPTSFRRKGNHLPLPVPFNLFQSYLRRWNDFSGDEVDQVSFLDWVDEGTVILSHQLQSVKVTAGKSGAVTGFTGSVQLGLTSKANQNEFVQLWHALGRFAPYCGTGHKTTFGLGQTRSGWSSQFPKVEIAPLQTLLAGRVETLTELFFAQRKRTGGDRATQTAETWAIILARRELGESLQAIADDLEMPYETVKTYAKLARKALKT